MFVDDPGAVVALDRQDPALQLGIGMGADSLLQGGEQAVGQAFEGAVGSWARPVYRPAGARTTGLSGLARRRACIPAALLRRPVGNRP